MSAEEEGTRGGDFFHRFVVGANEEEGEKSMAPFWDSGGGGIEAGMRRKWAWDGIER